MNSILKQAPHVESESFGVYPTPESVHLERILPGPIERVWAYLTEPEKRAKWFAGGGMATVVGDTFELLCGKQSLAEPGETPARFGDHEKKRMSSTLTRFEPPHTLGFTFGVGPDASEVLFELQPHAQGVLFVIKHSRLAKREDVLGVSAGWHAHLGQLSDQLYGRPVRPFWQRYESLEQEYRKLIPGLS